VLRCSPSGLSDIVDREILEKSSQRVEPQPSTFVHVSEPWTTLAGEGAAPRRLGSKHVHA